MTLYWTDLFLMSFFTAIALLVTIVWFWKKKFLFSVGERKGKNSKFNSRESSGEDIFTFETLQEMKNVLMQDDAFSVRISLHGKVSIRDADQGCNDDLNNYLQGLTSERRAFLSTCLDSALVTMIQGFQVSPAGKQFSELLRSCVLDLAFLIAFGTDSQFNPVLCETLKDVAELWPDHKGSAPDDRLDNMEKFNEARDVLEVMLKEKIERKPGSENVNRGSYIDHCIEDGTETKAIAKNVSRFLLCGTDSLYRTLLAALAHLTDSMDVLKKMQSELRELPDGENLVTLWLQHRGKVPYSESVLKEVLRLSTPVAIMAGIRKQGPQGQKDVIFTANLKAMLQNPKVWTDEQMFIPKRFLDDDGKVIQHEFFVPFGLGHSCCPAQDFSTLSCFVILATVLRRFITDSPIFP